MDAAEIAEMVRDLKLSKETGGEAIVITKEEERRGHERLSKTVVGKIFARRQVNRETLKTHIPKILRTRGGMELDIIGHNMFAISFALTTDKRVALEDGPWHFFQDLMIIKETNPMQSVAEVDFSEISMWIQCHNVPMACMETVVLERIGGKVGKVEEIDLDEGGIRLGRTIRMRVVRNLETPLIRFVPVNSENGEVEAIVIIQYEKLPHFCFACGRIGHILKDCEDELANKTVLKYDHRLRVGSSYSAQTHRSGAGGSLSRGGGGVKVADGSQRVGLREMEDRGFERGGEEEDGNGKEIVVVEKEKGEDESEGETTGGDSMEAEDEVGFVSSSEGGVIKNNDGVGERRESSSKGMKKRGDKWKRRARAIMEPKEGEDSDLKEVRLEKSGSKRRGLEVDEEDQTPKKRSTRTEVRMMEAKETTAEAAAQPRRHQ